MLDIFNDDAFGVVPLTDAINKIKFVPGRIGQMGLFTATGVTNTNVSIEERDGQLSLISPSPRGGPGAVMDKLKRKVRNLSIPHFEINDAVMAEEVQGVRAFGSETQVRTVQGMVGERLGIHSQSLEATHEFSRIGAIKGIVTYADDSTLNLFTEFGVSQLAEVDFDLDNANPAEGALRKKIAGVIRDIANQLDGVPFAGLHAFCGDAFWDDLIAHPEVRKTFLNHSEASELRSAGVTAGMSFGSFNFGGVTWENYRGSVGGTAYVNTDKCHIFPVGAPGLYRTYYAPADYVETVNTVGMRLTTKQYRMPNDKGIHLDTQMNALDICTRPNVLVQGKRT